MSPFAQLLFDLGTRLSNFFAIFRHGVDGANAVPADRGKLTFLEQIEIETRSKFRMVHESIYWALDIAIPYLNLKVAKFIDKVRKKSREKHE